MQDLLTPPPLLAASFLRPPLCTFARAFHVLPPPPARMVHAPPHPRSELRGTPRRPHDPECTRLSPGPGPRAVFLPPYFPHPPGAAGAPTLGPRPGSAQARGCTGRARGAGSAWASGGRGGGGSCRVFQAPRAAAAARTLGGGKGEGIKGAGVPRFPTPLSAPAPPPPPTVKGPEGLASALAGIICPPERKYVPLPCPRSPSSVPPGAKASLRVRAQCRRGSGTAPPRRRSRSPLGALQCAPPSRAGHPRVAQPPAARAGLLGPSRARRRVIAMAPGRPL